MPMILTGIAAFMIVAFAGWIVMKLVMPQLNTTTSHTDWHISTREYLIGLAVFGLVVVPSTMAVGSSLSVANTLRFEEFYNGVEVAADRFEKTCRAGTSGGSASSGESNCRYQYDSGQTYTYTVMVTQSYPCTGADGKSTTCTRQVPETRWASIYYPYATKEYTYAIDDSLGETFRFGTVYIPEDAVPFDDKPIPDRIPRGAPAEWLESKRRLDAGDPRPVTRMFAYDNYILAAKDDMLLPFSQDVERYQAAGLLPDHTANIMTNPMTGFNEAFAHKVSFVEVQVANEAAWQQSLMEFNAALGSQLRGDLHMVVIDSAKVNNPVTYLNALKAYWAGDTFKRRAIAKNAIIVVVGVQDDTVQWAKASTGMPFGNETMIQGIENFLHGIDLTPEAVIGSPKTIVTPATSEGEDDTVNVVLADSPGVLEDIILKTFPFERACMTCQDEGEGVGYDHLIDKIPPKPWHLVLMAVVILVASGVFWTIMGATNFFGGQTPHQRDPFDPYTYPRSNRVRL